MPNDPFGYVPDLPDDIRDVFMWLCQDVVALRQKWDFYKTLFEAENLSLLSALAVSSANITEEALRDSMTMAICRLSDPPQTLRQDNMTLRTLVQLCNGIPNLTDLEREFASACEPVRQIRNKRIGHNDLNARLQPQTNPLPGIRQSQVDTMVELAETILNAVLKAYVNGELHLEAIQQGGAGDLVFWLRLADKHKDDDKRARRSAANE